MIFLISNQTCSGTQTIHGVFKSITTSTLKKHMSCDSVRSACEKGCVNYGRKWCCPPDSSLFDDIAANYSNSILINLKINLEDMAYIKRGYQKIRAANSILKSKSHCLARQIETDFHGLSLLDGSCNLCKPCNKKLDLPCKKPNQMRFSMESTGLNVATLLAHVMDIDLLWYRKENLPKYTSVTSCVLHDFTESDSLEKCKKSIDSCYNVSWL